MDSTKFPEGIGGDIGGKTFIELLNSAPKIVQFVDSLWVAEKTTGVYKDFFEYIKMMLRNPLVKSEHVARAREYVKTIHDDEVPSYLKKFCVKK
mgnify:CR=1 FL=1